MTAATLAHALDQTRRFITRYVVITPHQATACALWVAHTYALDAADITPYLAFTSAEKQSGKSLGLEVVGSLVNKPWFAIRPSEAVLFRKIERDCPTLILDEVDTIWSAKARTEDEGLRALLNAGFRRNGSTVPRCVGPTQKLQDFATFCPKALGGIGDLPDTVADRCIPIRMERKHRDDTVERWRWKLVQRDAESLAATIKLAAEAALTTLEEAAPDLPDELSDRAQDAWEPLLAIADAAGDEWSATAREAARDLMANRIEEAPIGAQLLGDIRGAFNGDSRLSTKELVSLLTDIEDSPWGDWGGKPITGRRLAGLLRPYGVTPRKEGGWRGYFASDFKDPWARYLPQTPAENAAPGAESDASGVSGALREVNASPLDFSADPDSSNTPSHTNAPNAPNAQTPDFDGEQEPPEMAEYLAGRAVHVPNDDLPF